MKRFTIQYVPQDEIRKVVIVAENVDQATDVLFDNLDNAGEFQIIDIEESK